MDLLKEFEEYLPRWSNEKHLPIPTKQHMDRWYRAWNDFVKEELEPRWEKIRTEYKSLDLYHQEDELYAEDIDDTAEPEIEETQEEPEETEEVEQQEKNSWAAIQKIMKELE